jgi:hypothetical protein
MLSAFMRSFINDAELCCEHIGQQAALLWVGASRCPLLPRKRGFRAVPSAPLLGYPHIAWLAARTEARMELAMYMSVNKTRTIYDTVEGEIQ